MVNNNSMIDNRIAIRRPTIEDAQPVVDLVNSCSIAEGGSPDETVTNLLADWGTSGFALATDAWLALAQDGHVAGYEQIELSDDASPAELDGYVHPSYKGRGIGTRLLRLAQARAVEASAQQGAEDSVRLRATIEAANAAARALFSAEGYRGIRHFWRMEIDLDAQLPAPQWPTGITARTFVVGQDEQATYTAVEEAFADHWEHTPIAFDEWVRARTQRPDFDPALWFLALHGGEIVGTALCYQRSEQLGWVRGLGVRRGWRGRGLGLALLYQAFAAYYSRGCTTIGLGVDAQSPTGATRLYERAGMRVTEQYETIEKLVPR
jgi:mycothiol synthase